MFHKMPYRTICILLGIVALASLSGCKLFTHNEPIGFERERLELDSDTDRGFPVGDLDPRNLGSQLMVLIRRAPNSVQARQSYAEAEAKFQNASSLQERQRRRAFRKAADGFLDAAKEWPESELEQDALFMAAESYFFADDYPEASDLFERVATEYPYNRHTDLINARRFRIAQYWLAIVKNKGEGPFSVNITDHQRPWRDSRGHSLRIFDKIRIDDPRGKLADDATLAAANSYFESKNYYLADEYYEDLRSSFLNSEHQFMAHYLGVQAKLRSYRGPEYSGAVLDDAEKLVKQIWRQFPVDADKRREELNKTWAEIRHKQAERDWWTAKFYERQKAYGSAKYQYAQIMKKYDDTGFAQEAKLAYARISDRPDVFEVPFAWIEDYVPTTKKATPLVAVHPTATDTIRR
jgi:outer membrane protein assembly factor BamD (BamD/ComL family)